MSLGLLFVGYEGIVMGEGADAEYEFVEESICWLRTLCLNLILF